MKKIGFMDFIIQSPNEEAILQVTNNLPVCNPPRPIPFIDCAADASIHDYNTFFMQ